MPQAIPVALAAIKTAGAYLASASTAVAAGTAGIGQTLAVTAANLAISATLTVAASALQPGVKTSGTAIDWTADPNAPLHFAFGEFGLAGQIVHCETFGPDLMYAGFVSVFSAAGPIDGFVSYSSNDQAVTFDSNGKAITSEYANEMFRKTQIGSQPTATALSITGLKNGVTLPNWGSAYKLNAKAGEILILAENSKFTACDRQVPKGITVLRGLLCWDPRLDSTYPGGSGSCRLNDPSTWVYTTNAYLHALKWALGLWEGPTGYGTPHVDCQVGGIGALQDEIDVAAYVEAANLFEANEWSCAAWPGTDEDKAAVLDSFLQAGGAIYAEKRGLLSCVHRIAERASVATITGADTTGPIELDAGAAEENRINTLQPRFWGTAAYKWQMVAADPVTSTTWQEEDGQGVAVERSRGLDYNYVNNAKQARELAALQIAHTREGIRGVIPLRPYLQGLEVGDCITIDEPDFVLDGLKCLILDIDDETDEDTLRVAFIAESDGKYPFAYGLTTTPPPAPSLTPESNAVATPDVSEWTLEAGLIPVDGADVPALVLTGEVDNARATSVVFEYRLDGETDWTLAGTEEPNVTRKVITGVSTGQSYEVAVRYRVGARISGRLVLGPQGVGDTTPPGPVTSGTVTGRLGAIISRWTNPTDADFDLAKVYRHTSNDRSAASLIGSTRGTQFADDTVTPLTDFHVWVGTVDRSGNEQAQGDWAYLGDAQATDPGDLITSDDYSWDDLPGRPTELTDGRITDALETDGTLTSGTRTGSGLMLRTAGSEEFTGAANANYITATSELSDDANLGGTAEWTGTSGRPANLASLVGSEPILNTAITLSAAGVLSGGGTSVQVNLASLPGAVGTSQVADGAISGTKLADNAVDLAGAKVTGKSLANVDSAAAAKLDGIAAGATVGADFDTNVTNIPANLAALTGSEVINNATLQTALTTGSVIPAEAVTFTNKGALAERDDIDTPQIVQNAVTASGSAVTDARVTIGENGAYVQIQTLTITTTGKPVEIDWGAYFRTKSPSGFNVQVSLSRSTVPTGGGSPVTAGPDFGSYQALELSGDDFYHGLLASKAKDTPPAGTTTYTLSAGSNLGTFLTTKTAEKRYLSAREYKSE